MPAKNRKPARAPRVEAERLKVVYYSATVEKGSRNRLLLRIPAKVAKKLNLEQGHQLEFANVTEGAFLVRVLPSWKIQRRHEGWLEAWCQHGVGHSLGIHGCDFCCHSVNFPNQALLDDEKANTPSPPRKRRTDKLRLDDERTHEPAPSGKRRRTL